MTSTTTSSLHDIPLEFPVTQPQFRPTDPADIERAQGGIVVEEPDQPQASAAEREARGELIQGDLAGKTVYVKPVRQWRASALHALREGDLMGWAEATLSDDDWEVWEEVDPTIEQIQEFFASINTGLGTDPGNSRASRRSSMRTRRR